MLLSDTGFTGWELAAQLHRYEITELKAALGIPGTRAPITGGDSGGAGTDHPHWLAKLSITSCSFARLGS